MFALTKSELIILRKLSTPIKIQDFLDTLPLNWEKRGETYMSPRRVLQERKAHCLEGALLAATALWLQGEPPLLFDLKTNDGDDHVVALYRQCGYWGAISKTNHVTLRFRDPIYKTLRELALSYFHEYFDNKTGEKILTSCSARPFDLRNLGSSWITTDVELHSIAEALDDARHQNLVPRKNQKLLRRADAMELRGGKLIEWLKTDRRT